MKDYVNQNVQLAISEMVAHVQNVLRDVMNAPTQIIALNVHLLLLDLARNAEADVQHTQDSMKITSVNHALIHIA